MNLTNVPSFRKCIVAVSVVAVMTIGLIANLDAAEPDSAEAKAGLDLYNSFGCYQCHGTYGQGGNAGPTIAPGPLPYEAFRIIVRTPVAKMPPYTDKVLTDDQLRQIHDYLASIETGAPASDIDLLDVTIQAEPD